LHRELYGGTGSLHRSPLVGRSGELRQLEQLFARAAEGEGAAALVWGEAGIGKTRLLDEFASRASAAGAKVGKAGCFEFLCPPFAPLREVLTSFGVAAAFEADDAAANPLRSEVARYRAFVAAAESLQSLAGAMPHVLIVDDLQWADFGTLEFLTFSLPRLAKLKLLILAAVRLEQLERDHARRESLDRLRAQGAHSITVLPLDETEMRSLVVRIWPEGMPGCTSELERVCALAEGKPYFAEELVSSAVTTRAGGIFDATPLSIRAGVLARFEQLSSKQQRTVLCASVIGRSFDASLLAQITESTRQGVTAALSRARELQLVRAIEAPPTAFTFRHAITREILYRELLSLEAQSIHRRVALCLERDATADGFDVAYHWSAAGETERASSAYERAGDAALARVAHRDAEGAYRAAVDLRNQLDATYPALCEKLSRALSANGEVVEACAVGRRALERYVAMGRTEPAASLAIRLARRIYESGRPQDAEETARSALRLSGKRGAVAYDAYVTLAHFEALQDRSTTAIAYLDAAEGVPGEHPPTYRRNAHLVRALIAAGSGRLADAFDDYEAAIAIARELGDIEQLAWTLNNYASRAMATGWMERALRAYREAAQALRTEEFGKVSAATIQGLAFAELLAGNLASSRTYYYEGAQLPPGIAMTQTSRTTLGIRLAYYANDDAEAARLVTAEAIELAFDSGETQRIGLLAGCVAAWYDASGRRDDASALRSRALAAIGSVDFSFWLLDQLAASASAEERARSRRLLEAAAADPSHRAARAHLQLFDARRARAKRNADAKLLANEAAAQFDAIGWPWERAQALEIGGRHAEALALYHAHGFTREERAVERSRRRTRHRASLAELTPREFEVAKLAAAGKTNRAIASELFIGERTVETHIAAMFDRFDLTSRQQLSDLLRKDGQVGAKPSA
jgi:DNA-binding CsgD family transcriptional regulator